VPPTPLCGSLTRLSRQLHPSQAQTSASNLSKRFFFSLYCSGWPQNCRLKWHSWLSLTTAEATVHTTTPSQSLELFLYYLFYLIVFTFTYMCIHNSDIKTWRSRPFQIFTITHNSNNYILLLIKDYVHTHTMRWYHYYLTYTLVIFILLYYLKKSGQDALNYFHNSIMGHYLYFWETLH
jgi:hypothetical protein